VANKEHLIEYSNSSQHSTTSLNTVKPL